MSMDFTQHAPKAAVGIAKAIGRDYGTPVPKALTDGLAELDRLEVGSAPAAPAGSLGELLVEHAIAGTDPLDDERIKRHALAAVINQAAPYEQVQQTIAIRRRALVKTHAPALIKSWSKLIEEADQRLNRAREEIPGLDLDAPHTIASLKPGQMTLWGEAREARLMVQRVVEAWALLVSAVRLAPVDDRSRVYIYTDPTPAQVAALRRPIDTDAVIAAGLSLTLATPAEFMDRVARASTSATMTSIHSAARRTGVTRIRGGSVDTF